MFERGVLEDLMIFVGDDWENERDDVVRQTDLIDDVLNRVLSSYLRLYRR